MATSTLFDKLKSVSKNQKDSIKESLQTQGELPWLYQILIAIIFWFLLFIIMFLIWDTTAQWGAIIIASIGSVVSAEGINYLIRRITKRTKVSEVDEEIVEDKNKETLEFEKHSILIGNLYKRGFAVLTQRKKNSYILIPIIILEVHLVSSSLSLLSSLSNVSLQKISLLYNCSIVDTSNYEVLILKGSSQSCKHNSLLKTIRNLENTFFVNATELVYELKREKRIEFESPRKEILKELFPSHNFIVDYEDHVAVREEDDENLRENIEEKTESEDPVPLDENELFTKEELDYLMEDIAEEKLTEEESEEDKIQKSMVKEVLLKELDFSIDSFLTTSKEYYKKAIEKNLENRFVVKTNTFLKFVHLFCDKKDIPFFYPSYSYLLKIIEFLDVEMPSSTEIENFTNKLANEYVDVVIPEEIKDELNETLEKKFNNSNLSNQVILTDIDSKISSIPLPPDKNERGELDD
jgi:hypothetical protein